MTTAYEQLEKKFAAWFLVKSGLNVLDWDRQVKMPATGFALRSMQMAELQGIAHDMIVRPDIGALLETATTDNEWQKSNLAHMKRIYLHETAMPRDMVEAFSTASSNGYVAWEAARAANDYKLVEKPFAELLKIQREVAVAKGAALGVSPYDSLIDLYDPHNTSAAIDVIFAQLEKNLPDILSAAIDKQAGEQEPLKIACNIDDQKLLGFLQTILTAVGFDFNQGRLDIIEGHPFSKGLHGDVRITIKKDAANFMQPVLTALHEAGHGIFDGNCPKEWLTQPVGNANSMGQAIHESQSLIFEKVLGRTPEFCNFVAAKAQEMLGVTGSEWTGNNIHAVVTRVSRSFIRIKADEISYPLHIILRYKLEKAMIEGQLEAGDLPSAWNELMKKYLGVTVGDDHAKGCLQDVHWYDGAFGYFTTYSLGAIYASQMFGKLKEDRPDTMQKFAAGDFGVMREWLQERIYKNAALYTPQELIRNATGTAPDVGQYLDYLKKRYL